ncbi:Peroxisomal acyl-coenzyme A oxidase 3 [Portunus trituberculatus]|uniref:Peroxisomal acyl-coenzyme A oxidase 3 n=1 Tax=Portunus trituberculatus TaxID=210409 RepID=A0A5B7DFY1_PORTR|nr:Peroxisomal acyl-coenzyme A oxidase 3 [Portunus trituberculatus]
MAASSTYVAGHSEGTDLDKLVPDLPSGPLDKYRAGASFNWKEMKAYIDPPHIIAFKPYLPQTAPNNQHFLTQTTSNHLHFAFSTAKTASHGLVFAQLYTPDGVCHGLHCFIVPLRDPHTLQTYPGITIVDMGHKIGLNGIDNGWQWRLFPYIAATYAMDTFAKTFAKHFFEFRMESLQPEDKDRLALFGQEVHGLSSAGKPLSGWLARDCIQECREACGGHGYLKYKCSGDGMCSVVCTGSGLGMLRDDNDANCTYEGDNNILLQQTSNWLLGVWANRADAATCLFPMHTTDYLQHADHLLSHPWTTSPITPHSTNKELVSVCRQALQWLVCWLCLRTSAELDARTASGQDQFTVRNNIQVYLAHTLSLAYVKQVVLTWFEEWAQEAPASLQPVLYRLCALYGLTQMEKHMVPLVEGTILDSLFTTNKPTTGGLVVDRSLITTAQQHIRQLCGELLPDAVALVDSLAPPDFFLHSVLGNADGKSHSMSSPHSMFKNHSHSPQPHITHRTVTTI